MKFKLAQPQFIYELGQRKNQEDSIFPAAGTATSDSRLFIVCDGMGGHSRGEVASKTVCDALSEFVLKNINDNTIFTDELFNNALEYAYQKLDEKNVETDAKRMGTTLTFVLFHKGGCFIAHMGDSRIYHIRPKDKSIKYISRDHSLVFDLFRMGEIKYEEMQTHPKKNVITKAMMPGDDYRLKADIVNTTDIEPGDYFYLCSDGMLEKMEETDILGILSSDNTDEVKQQRLISATLENADNHSAYIIRVEDVVKEGDENTYRNDEASSRSNIVNYIPELKNEEATKVGSGAFTSDTAVPLGEKKLFPWVKIMVVLIALAIVGLFILPKYWKESQKVTKDEKGNVYNDSTTEDIYISEAKKDTVNKQVTETNQQPKKPVQTQSKPKPSAPVASPSQPAPETNGDKSTSTGGSQTEGAQSGGVQAGGAQAGGNQSSGGQTSGSPAGGKATSSGSSNSGATGGNTSGGTSSGGSASSGGNSSGGNSSSGGSQAGGAGGSN